MKTVFLVAALTTILTACGHGYEGAPQQEPIKVEEQSPYLSPRNEQTGVPYAVPFAYEEPIDPVQMKYLNVGVARAIAEYKMVGEALKADLAAEMGEGIDAWIKKDVTRCIAPTAETFINQNDWYYYQSSAMCMGWAYGNWALVNGIAGSEGTLVSVWRRVTADSCSNSMIFPCQNCRSAFRQMALTAKKAMV